MDNGGKATIAFLLGVIAGGVAGLLFAPKTGDELRDDVNRYAKDAGEKISRKKDELKKRMDKAFHSPDEADDSEKASS
jgi:gas vesicle protein